MTSRSLWFTLTFIFNNFLFSQGTLTGNYRLNMDFYDRDTSIATQGPNYEYNKNSANAWIQTIYSDVANGFEAGLRFDGNYNSILQNPPTPVTFYGIGNWYIKKKMDNLQVQGGYIYEQYGSGIALRAFEERNLGIDNAIFGVKAKYNLSKDYAIRIIAGTQKYRLEYFGSFVKGLNFEGSHTFDDNVGLNFGASVVNRTLIKSDRDAIDNVVNTYKAEDYFQTPYNAYIFQFYNTLQLYRFSWNTELAYKTKDAVFNGNAGKYIYKPGISIFNSISYSKPSLGVTLQNRYIENFQFQSTTAGSIDFNVNNNRRLTFLTPINRQNSLRLPARFQIAPQEINEFATSLDVTYSPTKKIHINLNLCMIDSSYKLKNQYYQEAYLDVEFKKLLSGKLDQHFGVQYVFYNQYQYQREGKSDVRAYTVFTESSYRFNKKKSIRLELQYQNAAKELGQSVFALLEYNIAPNWSFSVSDLWSFKPNSEYEIVPKYRDPHHFYSVFGSYTKGTMRFTLAYSKQLAGIVCTGGVCRFEPAFSGLRAQLTSSF